MLPPEFLRVAQAFNNVMIFSEASLLRVIKNAAILHSPKKTKLLEIGQVCNKMYFIVKGCVRLYYEKDDTEINCFFFHENLFCTALGSFMMQRKSNQIMETIEDTILLSISYAELQQLYDDVPEMNKLVRKIVEERYTNAHDVISSYLLDTPEQRYEGFLNKYPALVNRIPEYHVASYLGITPKSLSRMKKRIYAKTKKVT